MSVLLARIKNLFRHIEQPSTRSNDQSLLVIKDLTIDPAAHVVYLRDQIIELTPVEFDLLHTFAMHPNKVLTIDDLLASVWGAEFIGQSQVVYVHIRWLREKIEQDPSNPKRIMTVRGVGYKLIPQD